MDPGMMNNMLNMMMMNNMNNPMMMNNMNNMNPMMMNNMNNMNPMMMNNMNPMMMNQMMMLLQNMNNNNGGNNNNNNNSWNLIFEKKAGDQTVNISVSPDSTVLEAINLYKLKVGQIDQEMKFIFNGKQLDHSLKVSEAGLNNLARITVITTNDVQGAKFIIGWKL